MTASPVSIGRSINCAECGVLVEDASSRRKYCIDCAKDVIRRRSSKGGHKPRACLNCSHSYAPASSSQRFCSIECRQEIENKNRRLRRAERGGSSLGTMFCCIDCGVEMVRRSGIAKRCAVCRDIHKKVAFRDWSLENRDSIQERKARYRKNPRNRLDNRMGCAIWQCLREEKNGWRWESLVGYTLDELAAHLEAQFLPGMSWSNMDKWHIDHRVPKSFFDYETPDCPDFKFAWALTNLQPIWTIDNLKKGSRRLYLV